MATEETTKIDTAGREASPKGSNPKTPSQADEKSGLKPGDAEKATRSQKRAVVVGINNYGGINNLPSCVQDAKAFSGILERDYGYTDIKTFLDADATIASVSTSLKTMLQDAKPDDRLVFFHSGHGSTQLQNGVLEECIVLADGFYFGNQLSSLTQSAPPGILTVVLDSCFSGGMNKNLLMPVMKGLAVVDRVQIKAWTRPDMKDFLAHADEEESAISIRRFGEDIVARPPIVTDAASSIKRLIQAPPDDQGRLLMNGLLMSACLETETAAASTPQTQGKSAYTFCLLDSLDRLGIDASVDSLVEATQQKVKSLGLKQTPLVKNPPRPAHLEEKAFLTFDDAKAVTATPVGDQSSSDSNATMQQAIEALLQGLIGTNKSSQIQSKGFRSPNKELTTNMDLQQLLPLILLTTMGRGSNAGDSGQPQKLFGIDDAILIPALAGVITSLISKKSAPPPQQQQKLFGIDDAILIPALAGIITAALSKKSLGAGAQQKDTVTDVASIASSVATIAVLAGF